MIAIIADDFSGAAELAGIAAARGFQTEVQTEFDPGSAAQVIAVDTDTRLKPETEAVHTVAAVTRRIVEAKPAWIYKKTDSVLRGHVRAEIESILDVTGMRDCLFIPANPSKDRLIVDGRYFVSGVPLDQTVFAHDPDDPRRSAVVRDLLGESARIRTPDARSLEDLNHSIAPATLAAGAADFFGVLLGGSPVPPARMRTEDSLLLCGSLAAWETGRATQMTERGFTVRTLTEPVSADLWQQTRKLMLAIGKPPSVDVACVTEQLIDSALPLIVNRSDIRIGLEGGATAMAFIRRMGWTRFEVIPEGHVGVGSLRPPGGPVLCVKPGSYPWPQECFP